MVIVIQLPQNIIGYIFNERFLAVLIHLLLRNAYKMVVNNCYVLYDCYVSYDSYIIHIRLLNTFGNRSAERYFLCLY
jgi:hypothetical protein